MKFGVDETEDMLNKLMRLYSQYDTTTKDRNVILHCMK